MRPSNIVGVDMVYIGKNIANCSKIPPWLGLAPHLILPHLPQRAQVKPAMAQLTNLQHPSRNEFRGQTFTKDHHLSPSAPCRWSLLTPRLPQARLHLDLG